MKYEKTEICGVWLITPECYGDSRGYFMETFKSKDFAAHTGVSPEFVQDNESLSGYGVLRGLHMQLGAKSQAKLVRVSEGSVMDVVVDLRKDSPTYGKHLKVELSAENHRQMYVPRGLAHGFVVLSERAKFQYKVDNEYCPEAEMCIRFDDPTLAVEWPEVEGGYNLSAKDLAGKSFKEAEPLIAK